METSASEGVVCGRNTMVPMRCRTMTLIAASLVLGMVHVTQAQVEPFLVKDINVRGDASCGDHSLSDRAVLGDSVYFAAGDCTHGMELWKSDGTDAGTALIKDVYPGGTGSRPRRLMAAGESVLFLADDGVHGLGLWRSDGSEAGTVLVKAPFPDSTKTGRVLGIVLLFDGLSLWRSDSTEVGTRVVKQFDPAEYSNESSLLVGLEDSVLFSIYRKPGYWGGAYELWKSDGTTAGTVLVTEVPGEPSLGARGAIRVGANVFFSLEEERRGNELWKSDGTAAGTRLVRDINHGYRDSIDPRWGETLAARRLAEVGGVLFFTADDGTHGPELWRSDGTVAGTVMVKDIVPGRSGSSPAWLTNHEGTLVFVTPSPSEEIHLWRSDGTADGTVLVKSSTSRPNSGVYDLIAVGGTVFFSLDDGGIGRELWGSDGTAHGTRLIRDINPGPGGSDPRGFVDADGRLIMIADDGSHGPELWTSDATEAGTRLVSDIDPSTADSWPRGLHEVEGVVFLFADDGIHGLELWRTDGSEAGTTLVADINPGPEPSSSYIFEILDGTLFFWAEDGTHGQELWRSDGTTAGTTLVADINTGEDGSLGCGPRARMGRHFFFTADDGIHGRELWRSDGTEAGTMLVKDVNPAGDAFEDHANWDIVTAGDIAFFVAEDGIHGRELWKSDGTEAGTMLVADIKPGTDSSHPEWLASFNGMVFFGASPGEYDQQPWRSDGTAAGTIPLAEFDPALSSIDVEGFREVEGTMYFSVWAEEGDISLWRTDGTPEGTVQVTPFRIAHHYTPSMVMLNGTLFLLSREFGELWKTDGTVEGTTLVKRIDLPPDWYDYEDYPAC